MTAMWVVGVDPGAVHTGICRIRIDDGTAEYEWSTTVHGKPLDRDALVDVEYLDKVAYMVQVTRVTVAGATVVVEQVTAPKGFREGKKHPIDPAVLIATAAVAGHIAAEFRAHLVPAGGNGAQAWRTYPDQLLTTADRKRDPDEKAKKSRLQHERSAHDCAVRWARQEGLLRAEEVAA